MPTAHARPALGTATAVRERVILVHGIWMRGITLLPLARRLRALGYRVETFDYASIFGGVASAATRLRARMRLHAGEVVHLVGHSLGALVALEAVRGATEPLPSGRIVCLGPPLRGSAVARGLARYPGGRWLMGQSADALLHGFEHWDGLREVGVIAGESPYGLGAVLGTFDEPHDGTVAVAETRLTGIEHHCTVTRSHSGLLLSSAVVDRIDAFLHHGDFDAHLAQAARA